jgi:chaperonin GroES
MLKPLEDKVIVKPIEDGEQVTASGLIVQTFEKERPSEAIVVAVGPGMTFGDGDRMTIDLNVGDKVIFAKYQGTEIEHEGEKLLILAYRDIVAVIGE